ncbi:class I SAM-dependent methyltransferase [Roseateles sp.]|uniref:class I SAM-dependent methyltransferase n=1 Tax=Roseateles sp. TaxID=1971397 RepID=UPI003266932D
MSELDAIAQRYARREADDRYSLLRPEVWQMWQERQRELLKLLAKRPGMPAEWRATEVGCGAGGNLLDLLRLGLLPAHLTGVELLPKRLAAARAALPEGVRLLAGDASTADVAPASQDLVLQSTVFSSILDDELQQRVADAIWRWLKPGGAVVWYDFTVNNPRNPDVRGVPLKRVRELFPQGRLTARRVTLAPPLARALPGAYPLLNLLPLLRTHRLVLIEKP